MLFVEKISINLSILCTKITSFICNFLHKIAKNYELYFVIIFIYLCKFTILNLFCLFCLFVEKISINLSILCTKITSFIGNFLHKIAKNYELYFVYLWRRSNKFQVSICWSKTSQSWALVNTENRLVNGHRSVNGWQYYPSEE